MCINLKQKNGGRLVKKGYKPLIIIYLNKIIEVITPAEDGYMYRKIYLKIRECDLKISVKKFTYLRLLIPLALVIPVLSIINYNINYSNLNTIREIKINKSDFILDNSQSFKDLKEEENKNEYYFNVLREKFTFKDLRSLKDINEMSLYLTEKTGMTLENATSIVKVLSFKMQNFKSKSSLILAFIATFVIGYKIPDLLLHFIHKYKTLKREEEKILINELVVSLGNIKNIRIERILEELKDASHVYKYLFEKCVEDFESGDGITALNNFKENTDDQDLIELADMLILSKKEVNINDYINSYEQKIINKNKTLEVMEAAKQEMIMTRITIVLSISMFVVVFSMIYSMLNICNILS